MLIEEEGSGFVLIEGEAEWCEIVGEVEGGGGEGEVKSTYGGGPNLSKKDLRL